MALHVQYMYHNIAFIWRREIAKIELADYFAALVSLKSIRNCRQFAITLQLPTHNKTDTGASLLACATTGTTHATHEVASPVTEGLVKVL